MKRLWLFGDSVIDNGSYVGKGEPDVTTQITEAVPSHKVVSKAVDGSVVADVTEVLRVTETPLEDRIVISAGGNDALLCIGLLSDPSQITFGEAMIGFRGLREAFRKKYVAMLDCLDRNEALLCTIYNPRFEGGEVAIQEPAEAALSAFNDVIQQEGLARGHSILDVRRLFLDYFDYANPIEPSAKGGAKIANEVAEWMKHSSP